MAAPEPKYMPVPIPTPAPTPVSVPQPMYMPEPVYVPEPVYTSEPIVQPDYDYHYPADIIQGEATVYPEGGTDINEDMPYIQGETNVTEPTILAQ